jgi:hypothetical protein
MNTSFDSRLIKLLATIHQNGKLIRGRLTGLRRFRAQSLRVAQSAVPSAVQPIAVASVA